MAVYVLIYMDIKLKSSWYTYRWPWENQRNIEQCEGVEAPKCFNLQVLHDEGDGTSYDHWTHHGGLHQRVSKRYIHFILINK